MLQRLTNNSLSLQSVGLDPFLFIRRFTPLITGPAKLQDQSRSAPEIARLTRLMAKGDEGAYRQFHDAYFGRLLGYLLVVTGNEQLAREAVQATLLRVVRYARQFDSEEAFWGWLTVLARSSATDENRRSRRYASFLERFFERALVEREDHTDETRSRLRDVLEMNLAALPVDDRELLERKYFDRQSVHQIAENNQTSEKAVESRLVRIRQKLRDMVLSQLKHEG